MASRAQTKFHEQKQDIDQLWAIHTSIGGAGRGRKSYDLEILNRTVIVFVAACWESYVEDVIEESFNHLLRQTIEPSLLPEALRNYIWADLSSSNPKDPKHAWGLAGAGWKNTLVKYAGTFIAENIEKFHTPKTDKVDELFAKLIGLKNLSSTWSWQKMSQADATKKLDYIVSVRGKIAHRLKFDKLIDKKTGWLYMNHIEQLVLRTDEITYKFLEKNTGIAPWS